jgi:hypothetical protein
VELPDMEGDSYAGFIYIQSAGERGLMACSTGTGRSGTQAGSPSKPGTRSVHGTFGSLRSNWQFADIKRRAGTSPAMTDADEARYLARVGNLVDAFRQIAKNEHRNVRADAALAFLAEALASHPDREEMVQHVLEHLPTIVDEIIAAELRETTLAGVMRAADSGNALVGAGKTLQRSGATGFARDRELEYILIASDAVR